MTFVQLFPRPGPDDPYVISHLFILKSSMLFLCPGWIYGKYAISTYCYYVQDESAKWLLYVILQLLILMSNLIFLCPGWIYEMFTIFIYIDFYVKDDYTKCMQYPPWYSYVKDESTKWLRYVILHLLNHMSNMIFLCPGWIYGKYAISNIILCPGWIYEMFTIWIYTCLCLCPTWVSYVKDESTKWLL